MWSYRSPRSSLREPPVEGAGDFGAAEAIPPGARRLPDGRWVAPRPPTIRVSRRTTILGALALACASLASCGFQLRGTANFTFDSIYVGAPPTLPFTVELKRALAGGGSARVMDAPQGAQVVLDISNLSEDKAVLSLSPGGRVREFVLTKRVAFSLRGADGVEWLPLDEIVVRRAYTYDDTERLAREIQEQRLLAEMQTDAIAQLVRRLQAAKKP